MWGLIMQLFSKNFIKILSFILIFPSLCFSVNRAELEAEGMARFINCISAGFAAYGPAMEYPRLGILGSAVGDLACDFMDEEQELSDKEKVAKVGALAAQAYMMREANCIENFKNKNLFGVPQEFLVPALRVFSSWAKYKSITERHNTKNPESGKSSTKWRMISHAARAAADGMSLNGPAQLISIGHGIYELWRGAKNLNPDMFVSDGVKYLIKKVPSNLEESGECDDVCCMHQYNTCNLHHKRSQEVAVVELPCGHKLCRECFSGTLNFREEGGDDDHSNSSHPDWNQMQSGNLKWVQINGMKYFEAISDAGSICWWRQVRGRKHGESYEPSDFVRVDKPKCPECRIHGKEYYIPESCYKRQVQRLN